MGTKQENDLDEVRDYHDEDAFVHSDEYTIMYGAYFGRESDSRHTYLLSTH